MHHTAHALFEYAARGRVLFQKRRNLRFQFQKLNIQIRVNVPCVAGGIVWGARLKFFAARDGPAVKSHSTILQRLRRQISLDFITTAPTPNLTRLLHNTASYAG